LIHILNSFSFTRYQLAENIDSQMRRLADDLKEIIERMNAAGRQNEASADPVNFLLNL